MSSNPKRQTPVSKPILVVDHLSKDFGIPAKTDEKNEKNLNKNEEILLTLIANVVVEILLKEKL